jgi:hypothetical protein
MQKNVVDPVENANHAATRLPESKALTPAENLMWTIKILLGGAALVGGIWALDQFVI